ncbi:MAG: NAD(P)-dependent oxidoreductase [Planctomycetes bacterium]|nr:NAD(P)-dependent oxidoreductase [Planctomycetota bacterium]
MHSSVLVTGAGGFIGTWVLRELIRRDMTPIAFDVQRNEERWDRILGPGVAKVSFVSGSLLDRDFMRSIVREHRVTHLIHLAALLTPDCQTDPYGGCQINVLGSTGLFELAREFGQQIQGISYASSYAVYGPEIDDKETGMSSNDNRPPSFYGVFKLAVDLIAEQYFRHFGISSIGIRPHVVYGPERTAGLTAGPSLAAKAAVAGQSYTINYKGRVGYDYVEDVAHAFVRSAIETPRGSTVVDLISQPADTDDFVRVLSELIPQANGRLKVDGPSIPSNIPPKPNYITNLFPNWKTTTIEEGIQKTIDFYQSSN